MACGSRFRKGWEEALHMWSTGNYHLVLLDVQMPLMDGLEVLRRIRTEEHQRMDGKSTSIFMVTAFADDETRKMSKKAGTSGFLAKPYSPTDLLEVLTTSARNVP